MVTGILSFWFTIFLVNTNPVGLAPDLFQRIKTDNDININFTQTGIASWYGPGFHGKTTASGRKYNMHEMVAAHKSLKFGTTVKVTKLSNGKSVIVRIVDRGPFVGGRIIDLSKAANDRLNCNLCKVRVKTL